MDALEILHLIANAYFVFTCIALFIVFFAFLIADILKDDKNEVKPEGDIYVQKLDKLQQSVDCIASEHLDAEAMKEIQKVNNKPCISQNMALGFVDTLEESFGADPIYFDEEYAAAIEGLRVYIKQENKNASR